MITLPPPPPLPSRSHQFTLIPLNAHKRDRRSVADIHADIQLKKKIKQYHIQQQQQQQTIQKQVQQQQQQQLHNVPLLSSTKSIQVKVEEEIHVNIEPTVKLEPVDSILYDQHSNTDNNIVVKIEPNIASVDTTITTTTSSSSLSLSSLPYSSSLSSTCPPSSSVVASSSCTPIIDSLERKKCKLDYLNKLKIQRQQQAILTSSSSSSSSFKSPSLVSPVLSSSSSLSSQHSVVSELFSSSSSSSPLVDFVCSATSTITCLGTRTIRGVIHTYVYKNLHYICAHVHMFNICIHMHVYIYMYEYIYNSSLLAYN